VIDYHIHSFGFFGALLPSAAYGATASMPLYQKIRLSMKARHPLT
jgi:hypothetical protein